MHERVGREVLQELDDLHREATATYERVVRANPDSSFNQTLFGFVSRGFSFVDLLAGYWRGAQGRGQTVQMVAFMERFLGGERRDHDIAVRIWRHKLFHTARPRTLIDRSTGATVRYLIQWHGDEMSERQPHYATLRASAGEEIFGVACLPLVANVRSAAVSFFREVSSSAELQANVARFDAVLDGDLFEA